MDANNNNNNKIYEIFINLNYEFTHQLFFANVLHLYLLKNNICKNHQITYKLSYNKQTNDNILNLPIYGIHKKNINLDDKNAFYDYVAKNKKILKNIRLIPTYNKNNISNVNVNIHKKYIVKHKHGKGSINNTVVKDNLCNLLKKYDPIDYQIQDLIKYEYVYGVNCCCDSGKILSVLCYKIKSLLKRKAYNSDIKALCNNYIEFNKIEHMVKKIIKNINYTGFIEFEFLITNKHIYIMECNPRISGLVVSKCYYIVLIKKYIDHHNNKHHNNNIDCSEHGEYSDYNNDKQIILNLKPMNCLRETYLPFLLYLIKNYTK